MEKIMKDGVPKLKSKLQTPWLTEIMEWKETLFLLFLYLGKFLVLLLQNSVIVIFKNQFVVVKINKEL